MVEEPVGLLPDCDPSLHFRVRGPVESRPYERDRVCLTRVESKSVLLVLEPGMEDLSFHLPFECVLSQLVVGQSRPQGPESVVVPFDKGSLDCLDGHSVQNQSKALELVVRLLLEDAVVLELEESRRLQAVLVRFKVLEQQPKGKKLGSMLVIVNHALVLTVCVPDVIVILVS